MYGELFAPLPGLVQTEISAGTIRIMFSLYWHLGTRESLIVHQGTTVFRRIHYCWHVFTFTIKKYGYKAKYSYKKSQCLVKCAEVDMSLSRYCSNVHGWCYLLTRTCDVNVAVGNEKVHHPRPRRMNAGFLLLRLEFNPGWLMWDSWCVKWHCRKLLSSVFNFVMLLTFPALRHTCLLPPVRCAVSLT